MDTPPQTSRPDAVTLAVLVNDVRTLTKAVERMTLILERHDSKLGEFQTSLAVGKQTMETLVEKDQQIDQHLEATDARVAAIENDKRSMAGMVAGIGGLIGAVVAAAISFFKG